MGQQGANSANHEEVVPVSQIESLLTRVPGVVAARLVVNDWGGIEEIHVLATTERGPKQLVRDIESTLAARWGIMIDHKKISVAQLAHAESAQPPARLKLASFSAFTDAVTARYRCSVILEFAQDPSIQFSGTAEGVNASSQYPRLAAEAAVNALNEALPPGHYFVFEESRILPLASWQTAVVVLTYHGSGRTLQVLAGAAAAEADSLDAVIRACLQATNRVMERNLQRSYPRRAPAPSELGVLEAASAADQPGSGDEGNKG